jgi:hypothetical protein
LLPQCEAQATRIGETKKTHKKGSWLFAVEAKD